MSSKKHSKKAARILRDAERLINQPCPDCPADLVMGFNGPNLVMNVQHDDSCPTLAGVTSR